MKFGLNIIREIRWNVKLPSSIPDQVELNYKKHVMLNALAAQ